jgi:putative ABC transport system substrate-binding protein
MRAGFDWTFHKSRSANSSLLTPYGTNLAAMWRQGATFVVKILKGATAADVPVEQPTRFEPALNAKTAKSLGLAIPPPILVRADEVIE